MSFLLVGVTVLIAFMGGGFVVSVGSAVAILAYWLIGRSLLSRVVLQHSVDPLALGASSVIAGITTQVGVALLLQPVIPWRFTTGGLLGAAVVVGTVFVVRDRSLRPQREQSSTVGTAEVAGVLTVSLLYLGRDYRWANFAFVGVCIVCVAVCARAFRSVRILGVLVGTALVVVALAMRPRFWWFVTNDHQWFEAIGRSTVAFGPSDPVGANATLGYQYHFLTYAWTSGLGDVIGAREFVVLTRVAPVLCAALLSAVVWSFLRHFKRVTYSVRFLVAGCLPLLFDYSYTSPSHVFGMAQLVALVYLLTIPTFRGRRLPSLAIGLSLGLSLSLTKVSAAPPVVLGASCIILLALARRDPDRWQRITFGAGAVIGIGAHVLTQMFNSRTSRQVNTSVVFGFARERAADLGQLGYGVTGIVASVLVTSAFVLMPMVSVLLFRRTKVDVFGQRLLWFVVPSVPYVGVLAIASGNFSIGYFVTSGIYVLYVPMLIIMAVTLASVAPKSRILHLILPGVIIAALIERLRPFVNGGTDREVIARSMLGSSWIPALVVSLLFAAYRFVYRREGTSIVTMAMSAVTIGVLSSVSITLLNFDRLSKGPDIADSDAELAIGRDTQREVGEWLRRNVPIDAVVASNHFCGAACSGSGWFARDLSLMGDGFQLGSTPSGYGGSDFFLVIYSDRRFLVQSPTYLLTAGVDPDVLAERIAISTRFAENPAPRAVSRLVDAGVSYFVVDKRSTRQRDFSGAGDVVHENAEFIVVRLRTQRA